MKPHIRLGAEGYFCTNCGATEAVRVPIEIRKLVRLGRKFAAAHAACQPSAGLSKVEEARAEKEGGA